MAEKRTLFAFDFDHTIVEQNSDTWILDGCSSSVKRAAQSERKNYPHWTSFMNKVVEILHDNGFEESHFRNTINKMNFLGETANVLKRIGDSSFADLVIISDSNTFFISSFLEHFDLLQSVNCIYSNPAEFDELGKLVITPYHSHTCPRCQQSPNMCKGEILKKVVAEQSYGTVVYVGDGRNDLCPSLQLSASDHVIARQGYTLARNIATVKDQVKATIHCMDFGSPETGSLLLSFLS